MLRHPLLFALALSLSTASLADDWWDGAQGYQSSGGFKGNNGKIVGTPNNTWEQNVDNYINSTGKNTDPQINPETGTYETPAERIVRQSKIPGNFAPDPRKETVGTNGDPSSPGRLGLDEKLKEAAYLTAAGISGEKTQMSLIGAGYAEVGMMAFTNPEAADSEFKKLAAQQKEYSDNLAVFEAAEGDFTRGAQKLTRDSHLGDKSAPSVSATGAPTAGGKGGTGGAKVEMDDHAIKGAADKILEGLSPEKQEFLRDNGVSASDYATRVASGEFKSAQDMADFITRSAGGTPDDRSLRGLAAEGGGSSGEKREFGGLGNDEGGAVLSVKSGVTVSPLPQKDAESRSSSTKELISSLASYLTGNAKDRGVRVIDEDNGEVNEKDKRALLSFAMDYWKKIQGLEGQAGRSLFGDREDAGKVGGRRRTIFDIAADQYRKHGNDRSPLKTKGPVASR